MARDLKDIPENILSDLKERGLSDSEIETLSPSALLGEYLAWHGIFGYTDDIVTALDSFRA